jgi:peptidyl-prolyl cis-trans isomerase A (cyclophilin A)
MLAMANAGPGTNGSQFFITEGSPQWLDGHFTIFGQCHELDVVERIARVERDQRDRPLEPVRIRRITLTWF